jgi:hypothetical protein
MLLAFHTVHRSRSVDMVERGATLRRRFANALPPSLPRPVRRSAGPRARRSGPRGLSLGRLEHLLHGVRSHLVGRREPATARREQPLVAQGQVGRARKHGSLAARERCVDRELDGGAGAQSLAVDRPAPLEVDHVKRRVEHEVGACGEPDTADAAGKRYLEPADRGATLRDDDRQQA